MTEQSEKITEVQGPFRFAAEAPFDQTKALSIDDDELKKIQRFAITELNREDLAVFRLNLCNDQIDRHASRFPREELDTINQMIVGKPTMVNHDMNSLPRGRFFDSRIAVGPTGTQSVSQSREAVFVQPSTFMLRTPGNEEFIKHIEAGIYSGTSIGFAFDHPECSVCGCDLRACAHWPGDEYDGETCHYIMHKVSDVFEGSIVPLGSQGTEVVEARNGEERILPFKEALKQARDAYHEPVEIQEPDLKTQAAALRETRLAMRNDEGDII